MQMKTPKLSETHLGPLALQSAQEAFSGRVRILSKASS